MKQLFIETNLLRAVRSVCKKRLSVTRSCVFFGCGSSVKKAVFFPESRAGCAGMRGVSAPAVSKIVASGIDKWHYPIAIGVVYSFGQAPRNWSSCNGRFPLHYPGTPIVLIGQKSCFCFVYTKNHSRRFTWTSPTDCFNLRLNGIKEIKLVEKRSNSRICLVTKCLK